MTELTIGERIRELRRGTFTQHDLAAAADVSVDVIRKLEQGRRHTASIATLARIAAALGVDLAALLEPSCPVLSAGGDQDRVVAIRDALTSVDDLLGELDAAPDLTEFSRGVTYAFGLYWAGRYGLLAAMLPRLLTEAAAATHGANLADAARAADLAAQVHRIAASALLHFGAFDLAYLAARESLRLAALASDPLRIAAVHCSLGHVLMRQGRFIDAERICVAAAERIEPKGEVAPAQLSIFGGLVLRGATAAARQRRAGAATDLLAEATTAARRTGADRTDYDVVFGPGHMVMGAVDCLVVAEDYSAAAKMARTMPRGAALPLSTRSRHLADVAHAQLRMGRAGVAESVLLAMEQAAPEWTAHQRLPQALVGELMGRGRPSVRLRELAHRLNIARATRPS
ncbi:MAG: helix-turn-helix domain-containing protein [Pseudonocardiaceae bacterium]